MTEKRKRDGVRSAQSSTKVLRRMLSAAAVLFVLCLVFAAPVGAEGVTVTTEEDLRSNLSTSGTVILGQQIILTSANTLTVPNGVTVILDLNGYILGVDSQNEAKPTALITNNGDLTIQDSSSDKTGKITSGYYSPDTDWGTEGFPTYATNTIKNQGKLTVDSGTIESSTKKGGASYAIDCYQGSTLIVNGGTIQQTAGDVAIRMFANSNTLETSVLINDGVISGKRAVWIQLPGSNAANVRPVNLTVTGGTLISTDPEYNRAIYSYSYGDSFGNTKITITGGTFDGDVALTGGDLKTPTETVSVSGGTFIGNGVYSYGEMNSFITGGTFNISNAEALTDVLSYLADGAEVTINLIDDIDVGEFTGDAFTVDSEGGKVTLDLNGFTLSGTDISTSNTALVQVEPLSTLIVNDSSTESSGKMEISSTVNSGWNRYASVISLQRSTGIINGGTVKNNGGTDMAYGIDVLTNTGTTDANLIVNAGTIESTYIGIREFTNSDVATVSVDVNGGYIHGDTRAIWIQHTNEENGIGYLNINDAILSAKKGVAVDLYLVSPCSLTVLIEDSVLITENESAAVVSIRNGGANDAVNTYVAISNSQLVNPSGNDLVKIGDGFSTNPTVTITNTLVSTEVTGSKNVTQGVSAVFTAAPFNISAETPVKYEWSVDGTVVGGFTGETFAYTFDDVGEHVVSAAAIVGNAKAVGSFDVTVEAAKEIPKEEDQIQADINEDDSSEDSVNNNADFGSVNFSNQEFTDAGGEDQTITLAVKGNSQDKVEEHKALIPSAKKIVASYNITAADTTTTTDIHTLKQMAVVKISVKLEEKLKNGEKLQAYRFNEEKGIKAMPLKTEYYLNRSAGQYTYEVTIYTPGFSDFTVAQEETVTPGFELSVIEDELKTDHESKAYIFEKGTFTLPVNITSDDPEHAPYTYEFAAAICNVTNPDFTPTVNFAYSGDVYEIVTDSSKAGFYFAYNAQASTTQLGEFSLSVTGDDLKAGCTYKVVITATAESLVPGEETAGTASHTPVVYTLEQEFTVKDWLISVTDNRYQTSENPWNFTNPVEFEYIVYSGDYEGGEWPTVARNESSAYLKGDAANMAERLKSISPLNLSKVTVEKTVRDYADDSWVSASSVAVTRTDAGKISVVDAETDNPSYLKLTFTGYKMGDVYGEDGKVNLLDVDVLLHEIPKGKGTYVADNRMIYGDINADSRLTISDALPIFKFYLGYVTEADGNLKYLSE